jgi:hypothetical protein
MLCKANSKNTHHCSSPYNGPYTGSSQIENGYSATDITLQSERGHLFLAGTILSHTSGQGPIPQVMEVQTLGRKRMAAKADGLLWCRRAYAFAGASENGPGPVLILCPANT